MHRYLKRSILAVLGLGGIAAVYFLARALSPSVDVADIPAGDEIVVAAEVDDPVEGETSPQIGLTEEEIYDFFAEAKQDEETDEDEPYRPPVDFEALWELNGDVYAWITVPGTEIDYPILQHASDDTRYLNYNIDGSYGRPGCIYTEKMNSTDFDDPQTVIYGHNMRNGTMFAQLHEFRKSDFFAENREVIIYLPDRELRYDIFAAYIYDDRHLMHSFNFWNADVFAAYLKAVFDTRDMQANIDSGADVTADDRIITLSTCVSGQDDKRLLVHAVLAAADP